MPLIVIGIVAVLIGLVWTGAFRAILRAMSFIIAAGIASLVTFGASALLFSRLDAALGSGNGTIDLAASVILWLVVFIPLKLALAAPDAKSKTSKNGPKS
jgi:hypothetical protein